MFLLIAHGPGWTGSLTPSLCTKSYPGCGDFLHQNLCGSKHRFAWFGNESLFKSQQFNCFWLQAPVRRQVLGDMLTMNCGGDCVTELGHWSAADWVALDRSSPTENGVEPPERLGIPFPVTRVLRCLFPVCFSPKRTAAMRQITAGESAGDHGYPLEPLYSHKDEVLLRYISQ